jgi:predicted GNAT superfamily acetyltransferase
VGLSGVRLRPLAEADLGPAHALNEAAVPMVGSITVDELRWFAEQAFACWVAVDDDDAVGGLLVALTEGSTYASPNYRWFAARYPRFGYVDRVAVTPAWQGRGVGLALYRALIDALGGGWPVLCAEVNVRPRNDRSLEFHERFGFEVVGETEDVRHGTRVAMLACPLVGPGPPVSGR